MELIETMVGLMDPKRFSQESYWLDLGQALYNIDREYGLQVWTNQIEKANALPGNHGPPTRETPADPSPDIVPTSTAETPTTEVPIVETSTGETPTDPSPDIASHTTTKTPNQEPSNPVLAELLSKCTELYHSFADSAVTVKTLVWYAREDSPERYGAWHWDWCMPSMERALSGKLKHVAWALYQVYWLDFVYCPVGRWYRFKTHRWHKMHQGLDLRKAISTTFMKRFQQCQLALEQQLETSTDDQFKYDGTITLKQIIALIRKLQTVQFKDSLMTVAAKYFQDDRFSSRLDANRNILGLTNGVIEINACAQFRNGKPEDYVSVISIYHQDYTWQHPLVVECMQWFGHIFGMDQDLVHYFLKFAASCLQGGRANAVFTGQRNSSKTSILKLFEMTFGAYCIQADFAQPNQPLRIVFGTQDSPDTDCKVILIRPTIPDSQSYLFPFLSTWVPNPPEDPAQQLLLRQFKKNPRFENRFSVLAPAFLWIMVQYYPNYATEGLTEPPVVADYRRQNDVYLQFVTAMIQTDVNAKVALLEVYAKFTRWFQVAFPHLEIPDRVTIKTELTKRLGQLHDNTWHGIRIL